MMNLDEIRYVSVAVSGSGDNTLVAAEPNSRITLLAFYGVAAGAVTVQFESSVSGPALSGVMNLAAAGSVLDLAFNPLGWFTTNKGALLNVVLGGAVAVNGVAVVRVGG